MRKKGQMRESQRAARWVLCGRTKKPPMEDGWCVGGAPIEFVRDKTNFIAQYSTWQEAVNSKEFKVGGK